MTREQMAYMNILNGMMKEAYKGVVKIVEDFWFADMDGVVIFMNTLGWKYRNGNRFYKEPHDEYNMVKATEQGGGYRVRLVSYKRA